MDDTDVRTKHPSYVLVSFSRRQGDPGKLFGSSLNHHQHYITLQVSEGERIHDTRLGYDRYHGPMSGTILEIDLSAAQFAELITTMNVGCGVPGTMRRFQNKPVPKAPEEISEVEADRVKSSLKKEIGRMVQGAKDTVKNISDMLENKATIGKADRQSLIRNVNHLVSQFETYVPYLHERFEEVVEKTVTSAKTEIDSFLTTAAISAGFKALKEQAQANPMLTAGDVVEAEIEPEKS